MEDNIPGAEYLSCFLEGLLGHHFDKLQGQIQLCIGWKEHSASSEMGNCSWHFLTGSEESRRALSKKLNRMEVTENLFSLSGESSIEETREEILCLKVKEDVADSRLESNGNRKDLIWIFLVKEKNLKSLACQHLFDIVLDGLVNKFTDMIRLEAMGILKTTCENIAENYTEEYKLNNGISNYFFGHVCSKEGLTFAYVKHCLKAFGLPPWQVFVQISAMFYEKRTVKTRMYFTGDSFSRIEKEGLFFKEDENFSEIACVKSSSLRIIRKLMELSRENHGLLVEGPEYRITGIIRDNSKQCPDTYVEFSDHLVWKLVRKSEEIFEYKKGEYRLCKLEKKGDEEEQLNKLNSLPKEKIDKIKSTLRDIIKMSKHGTSIVFMDKKTAEKQVERLCRHNKGYWMEKFDLSGQKDELPGLISIDGAIIADLDCNCLGAGMILDGKSVKKGDVGRGARYNSVVNFINLIAAEQSKNEEFCCFAAIISEDRFLNIEFPDKDASKDMQTDDVRICAE